MCTCGAMLWIVCAVCAWCVECVCVCVRTCVCVCLCVSVCMHQHRHVFPMFCVCACVECLYVQACHISVLCVYEGTCATLPNHPTKIELPLNFGRLEVRDSSTWKRANQFLHARSTGKGYLYIEALVFRRSSAGFERFQPIESLKLAMEKIIVKWPRRSKESTSVVKEVRETCCLLS